MIANIYMKPFMILLILTTLWSCGSNTRQIKEFYKSNFKKGMSPTEVIEIFGEPENKYHLDEEKSIRNWHYQNKDGSGTIDFQIKSVVFEYRFVYSELTLNWIAILIYFDENRKSDFIVFGET